MKKQFKTDFESNAKVLFEEDLKLGKELGVRGFPSMFFLDEVGNQEFVYGTKAYAFYEIAILKLNPTITKSEYSKDAEALFSKYHSLTVKEYSELSGIPRNDNEKLLNKLSDNGTLEKLTTKNGAIWVKPSLI